MDGGWRLATALSTPTLEALELPLTDVTGAEALRTAWIIPNGLLVTTAAGGKERFMVEQNKRWSALIASAGQEPAREPAGAVPGE